jgi:hypothetical protein
MAVQVTGLFQNPATGLIYQSPLLTLVPHLEYAGIINMDVHIAGNGTVPYSNVDRTTLTYNTEITDPYNQLIDALETMVINNLKDANEINQGSTFEKTVSFLTEINEEENPFSNEEENIILDEEDN